MVAGADTALLEDTAVKIIADVACFFFLLKNSFEVQFAGGKCDFELFQIFLDRL